MTDSKQEFQNAHEKGVRVGAMLSSRQMEQMLGLPADAFSPLSWLALQQMAKGATPKAICESFGCSEPELQELIDATTQKMGDESAQLWQQGVLTLRTASQLNAINIGDSWDAVEALAVKKLHNSLSTMKTDGTPAEMLEIATRANKATRRNQGEGGGSRVQVGIDARTGAISATLSSGNLGMLSLKLSPAVKQQLESPERIIDVTPQRPSVLGTSKMLNLEQTRQVGDHGKLSNELDEKANAADRLNQIFGANLDE